MLSWSYFTSGHYVITFRTFCRKKPQQDLYMKTKSTLICLLAIFISSPTFSQAPKKPHSGEVRQMLEKLNVLGTVLYVAAHPDDENTRMIAYFANNRHMRTAYLSATSGAGGQNFIGSEIRGELGLILTQEL